MLFRERVPWPQTSGFPLTRHTFPTGLCEAVKGSPQRARILTSFPGTCTHTCNGLCLIRHDRPASSTPPTSFKSKCWPIKTLPNTHVHTAPPINTPPLFNLYRHRLRINNDVETFALKRPYIYGGSKLKKAFANTAITGVYRCQASFNLRFHSLPTSALMSTRITHISVTVHIPHSWSPSD